MASGANAHELNVSADRLHEEKEVVYGDACHVGIEKRKVLKNSIADFLIAMKP